MFLADQSGALADVGWAVLTSCIAKRNCHQAGPVRWASIIYDIAVSIVSKNRYLHTLVFVNFLTSRLFVNNTHWLTAYMADEAVSGALEGAERTERRHVRGGIHKQAAVMTPL